MTNLEIETLINDIILKSETAYTYIMNVVISEINMCEDTLIERLSDGEKAMDQSRNINDLILKNEMKIIDYFERTLIKLNLKPGDIEKTKDRGFPNFILDDEKDNRADSIDDVIPIHLKTSKRMKRKQSEMISEMINSKIKSVSAEIRKEIRNLREYFYDYSRECVEKYETKMIANAVLRIIEIHG